MLRQYESVLKAAADPNRARILKMLEDNEMCVCQIVAVLGLCQSTTSKHLAILRDAGLIDERKVARWVYYRLADAAINAYAPGVLALVRDWLAEDKTIRSDRERAACVRTLSVEKLCSLTPEEVLALGEDTDACCPTQETCTSNTVEEEKTLHV